MRGHIRRVTSILGKCAGIVRVVLTEMKTVPMVVTSARQVPSLGVLSMPAEEGARYLSLIWRVAQAVEHRGQADTGQHR